MNLDCLLSSQEDAKIGAKRAVPREWGRQMLSKNPDFIASAKPRIEQMIKEEQRIHDWAVNTLLD